MIDEVRSLTHCTIWNVCRMNKTIEKIYQIQPRLLQIVESSVRAYVCVHSGYLTEIVF